MIRLDYRDSRPIYEQVRDGLRRLMVTGVMQPGEQLPSVRSLAMELAINPNTIQRAYAQLEQEGYVYSVSGRGTFVAEGGEQHRRRCGALCARLRRTGDVRILLYQTWGRKEPCETLDAHGWTNREMTLRLAAAYEKIAAEQGCLVSPVGTAFYAVHTRHPEIALYTEDCSHPSLTGSYLAALCHFASLYGDSPLDVDYAPAGVDSAAAVLLRQAAAEAVSGPSIVTDEYRL